MCSVSTIMHSCSCDYRENNKNAYNTSKPVGIPWSEKPAMKDLFLDILVSPTGNNITPSNGNAQDSQKYSPGNSQEFYTTGTRIV